MAGRALPERAVAALRDAFAGEVATRLPGMQSAAAEVVTTGAVSAARTLISHAHTLASSAAVLGESTASRYARHCEELLVRACVDADVVPLEVAADAAADVEAVSLLLAPWLVA
ncbi:MAG TPA: Hpt domain-containing protein [Mycobacteriales bacterium]|jgi:HPt (histidine-containing phosphotransfer) domain-containing protein